MYSSPTRVFPSSIGVGATGVLAYTGGPLTFMLLATIALLVCGALAIRSSKIVAG